MDNSDGQFEKDSNIFYEWLESLEKSVIPSELEMHNLEKDINHYPFIHALRRAEYLIEKEDIKNKIIPNTSYLPYLQKDLSQIHSILLGIIENFKQNGFYIQRYDPNLGGISILHRCRALSDILISPHGFLRSKFDGYEDYLNAIDFCYEIQDKIIFELDSLNIEELKKRSEVSLNFVKEKLIEVAKDSWNTIADASKEASNLMVDAAKGVGNLAGETVGTAIKAFFGTTPVLLLGSLYLLWKIFPRGVKRNPPLLLINPPSEYKELWEHTKRLGNITENEFQDGLKMFYAQHGRYPRTQEIIRTNNHPGVNLAVMVGKVKDLTYDPPNGKKSPFLYNHKMDNSVLATDVTGKNVFFLGNTFMDKDGWLKK